MENGLHIPEFDYQLGIDLEWSVVQGALLEVVGGEGGNERHKTLVTLMQGFNSQLLPSSTCVAMSSVALGAKRVSNPSSSFIMLDNGLCPAASCSSICFEISGKHTELR